MIQWGIIGCGDVTEVKSGPAFNKVPGSKLVAVMRRNAEKAKDYASRHGVPKWYSNPEELIHDPGVSAIYIATPPAYHEVYAMAAIDAGKPVYLEKPMAMNAESAKKIAMHARNKNVRLSVAHYRRQQPKFLFIKKLLEQETVGPLQSATLIFSQSPRTSIVANTEQPWRLNAALSGGGLFHDLSPHQLDLMLYFFGKPLRSSGSSYNQHGLYEADDTVRGEILFEKNISFAGSWSFENTHHNDLCSIQGAKGTISFSTFSDQPVTVSAGSQSQTFDFPALPHVQQPMIEKVVEYFSGASYNPCSAEEGVIVMTMMDSFTGKGTWEQESEKGSCQMI